MLLKHMAWLYAELNMFVVKTNLNGKLTNSYHSNDAGFFIGAISYNPQNDPSEEILELCLSPFGNLKNERTNFSIDINWSDGTHVQELAEYEDIGLYQDASKIDIILEDTKAQILEAMKKQISIERPPHYREY